MPPGTRLELDRLSLHRWGASVERRLRRVHEGAWAFYLPALGAKFLHGQDGFVMCYHDSAPSRSTVMSWADLQQPWSAYSRGEWKAAYAKDVVTRVAENYVAAKRLHEAGLGPRPLGFCHARVFRRRGRLDRWGALGFLTDDVWRLPPRPVSSEADLLRAGVMVDKLRSSVRQQLNGYVTDLNSVVGVMPIDATREVEALRRTIMGDLHLVDPLAWQG